MGGGEREFPFTGTAESPAGPFALVELMLKLAAAGLCLLDEDEEWSSMLPIAAKSAAFFEALVLGEGGAGTAAAAGG